MFFRKKDLTDFTAFRAAYCRVMVLLIREKLHLKIFFTLLVLAMLVGFAYVYNKKLDEPYEVYEPIIPDVPASE